VVDVVEILRHWHAGRRIGQVCSSLAVDPKTVRKYTAKATEAGLAPGGPPLSEEQWSALVADWFPEIVDRSLRQVTWPEIEAHRERIKGWLGVVTVATIHQRLRDDHGLGVSESSLRRFIWANFDEEVARDAVRVLRDTPPAGDEAQVDYGLLGRWLDPATGRMRRVWGFMIVLTCSRLMFLRPVLSMDEGSWVEAHVLALEFFGGSPRRIVPDNLKTGVIKADLYDPLINKAFGEFAAHYGCLVDPARRAKPRDKATVERHVPYARDSFFAGRAGEFASLAAMQEDAVRWSRQVANQRQCRPLLRVAPQVVFDAEERDALLALPSGLRAGQVEHAEGRPRHPHQGGQGPVLGALAEHRQAGRRPGGRAHRRGLPRGHPYQDPRAHRAGQADRSRRLPAPEDRLHDAHPGVVPAPGR